MLPEIKALRQLRLDKEWTWDRLSREMRAAGSVVSFKTLQRLCTEPDAKLRELTLVRIQKYLAGQQRRRPRRARSSGSAAAQVSR